MSDQESLPISYPHYHYVGTAAASHHHREAMSLDRAYVHTLSGSSRGSHHNTPFEISGVTVQGKKFPLQEPVILLF